MVAGSIPVALAMKKDPPATRIDADDVSLQLVRDAEFYMDKRLLLEIFDGNGRQFQVCLDGIQVGDIIADARDCGMPVGWEHADGVDRSGRPRRPA